MAMTHVTSKGQVTIPHAIRSAMDIKAGDVVVFMMEGSRIVLVPIKRKKLTELRGSLRSDIPFPGIEEVRGITHEAVARHVIHAGEDDAD